uniref:Uncharacterized protein n=1 Tax=Arion vulgaris TaxID=1028688 RepID=A0A0B6YRU9_9EUPU
MEVDLEILEVYNWDDKLNNRDAWKQVISVTMILRGSERNEDPQVCHLDKV